MPEIIDEVRTQELEEALPETRWNLMANHNLENWRFMARYSDYDDWYNSEDNLRQRFRHCARRRSLP